MKLDANYFHREFVQSERLCPLADDAASDAPDRLNKLLAAIFETKEDGRPLRTPPTFYALLLPSRQTGGRVGQSDG